MHNGLPKVAIVRDSHGDLDIAYDVSERRADLGRSDEPPISIVILLCASAITPPFNSNALRLEVRAKLFSASLGNICSNYV